MSLDSTLCTRIPHKAASYGRETYFREAEADAADVFGADAAEALWRSALLMIKPDGLVTGKAPAILDYLAEHRFTVVAAARPVITSHIWRELWRYQLTAASLDRLAVNELVFTGTALMLLLRAESDLDLPATVWLSSRKGPANIAAQEPWHLRKRLGQFNGVLSLIHVADEPADLVRELGILLDRPSRRAALAALRHGRPVAGVSELVRAAVTESLRDQRDLDAQMALDRILDAVKQRAGEASEDATRVIESIERMRLGEPVAWRRFADHLAATTAEVDRWDLAAVGAEFIGPDDPGAVKLIENVDRALWRRRPRG